MAMNTDILPNQAFKRHRYPKEVISHAVWAYYRFSMSLRDVEDLLAERGIQVSYETIHCWVNKFGKYFAAYIRKNRPQASDKWPLDEVVLKIKGKTYYLWRAIDSNGDVLDVLAQPRRNTRAAMRFFRKLFASFKKPRVIITDKLGSYGAAKRKCAPDIEHRKHKGLNNKIEVSHRHTRRREKIMGRFKSLKHAQNFLSTHDQITCLFRPRRHTLSAISYRHSRTDAFAIWDDITLSLIHI